MTFMKFVRRLIGVDAEALATERRFQENLKRMDSTQEQLATAGASLDGILHDIEEKQRQLARSHSTSSGVSGQHRIQLPVLPPLPSDLRDGRDKKK